MTESVKKKEKEGSITLNEMLHHMPHTNKSFCDIHD